MPETIGATAGKIWHFLGENGPATANKISQALAADTKLTHLALGWLAREDKLTIDHSRRSAVFSLRA